ncbi:DUF4145 domain-containing protein [Nocardia sp. SYP-A9097]|uniref:DUF4145 domain-containing protein n=1 Tax=Nocardia sp. SYP-A9097 TaxID=2663237 RepID=UPI001891E66E|nr:DUF4145 domain-containing protein [Nocardia sp. SYP-A9097]
MQNNIRKLANPFREGDWPHLGCPVCGEGGLAVDQFDWEHQTGQKDHDDNPVDLAGSFVLRLVCGRALCASWVLLTGKYDDTEYWHDDSTNFLHVWPVLKVRTIFPPIPVLELTEDVPESVRVAVDRASALVWLDPLAFVAALRSAVERLMDEHGIPTHSSDGNRNSLHKRLLAFTPLHPEAGTLLLAAKWVGNTSAHENTELTAAAALDIAEMVEVALGVLYAKDNSALLARANRINTAKELVP